MPAFRRKQIRDRIVSNGRTCINRQLKIKSYLENMKSVNGNVNDTESIANVSSLNSMINAIEIDRLKRMVYDKEYQKIDLYDWIKMRDRMLRNRKIQERLNYSNSNPKPVPRFSTRKRYG